MSTYVEFSSHVGGLECSWQRRAPAGVRPLIVPDGCVDVVWFSDGRIEVAGPDTSARRVGIDSALEIVGVRFAPAVARAVSAIPIAELRNQQVSVVELGGRIAEVFAVLANTDPNAPMSTRRTLLTNQVTLAMRPAAEATLVSAAVAVLETSPGIGVADLAGDLGVSSRHLHRRFIDEVGYGPKIFSRVMRIRRMVEIAGTVPDLASLALASGFASQAHMGDEVRALTTLTPVRFLEERCGWTP